MTKFIFLTLLIVGAVIFSTDAASSHLGCYFDKGVRDLKYYKVSGFMRVEWCVNHCRKQGFKYAGLQARVYCFCGDSYGRYGKAPQSGCRVAAYKCPQVNNRGGHDHCGGSMKNDIYKTHLDHHTSRLRPKGCYVDKPHRDLEMVHAMAFLTRYRCYKRCKSLGYNYFGLQAGTYCTCGQMAGRYHKRSLSECNQKCTGTWKNECGGVWRNLIFPIHKHLNRHGGFRYIGCYKDAGTRDMPHYISNGYMNVGMCVAYCKTKHFRYAGLQYRTYCFCGNSLGRYGKVPHTDCHQFACPRPNRHGVFESCGGTWRNRIYHSGYKLKSAGLSPLGCFIDKGVRDLPVVKSNPLASREICFRYCRQRGYRFFGLQYFHYCTCGRQHHNSYAKRHSSECNTKCYGNWKEKCGGSMRNTLYDSHGHRHHPASGPRGIKNGVNSANNKGDHVNYRYIGCYVDKGVRDLTHYFPYGHMDLEWCLSKCKSKGYKYAGIQAKVHCFCGNSYGRYGKKFDDECWQYRCVRKNHHADTYDSCGGVWRNKIYATFGHGSGGHGDGSGGHGGGSGGHGGGSGGHGGGSGGESETTETTETECVDPYTKHHHKIGSSWTTKRKGFCFHYSCSKHHRGPTRTDCRDIHGKCIRATKAGNSFKCSSGECACQKQGSDTYVIQYHTEK